MEATRKMILILWCSDIEKSKEFYERYEGFAFKHEKHANGPEHYFGTSKAGQAMELYRAQNVDGRRAGEMTILLDVVDLHSPKPARSTVKDPDNRKLILEHTEA